MRHIVLLLIGLLAGALGASMAIRTLSAGSEYPKGVMALMGKHFGALREAAKTGECTPEVTASHAATLRQVALDVEPAFLPTGSDDEAFRANAELLRTRIAELEAALGQGCPALVTANAGVGEACKACHQDFRG